MRNRKNLKYLLLLLTCFAYFNADCQIFGLQPSYINPVGTYGQVFKPTAGIEGFFSLNDLDDRTKVSFLAGYYGMKTWQDTFSTYTISSASPVFLPGFQFWKNYQVVSLGANSEFKLLNKNLSPFLGFDIYGYFISYKYEQYTATVIDDKEDGGVEAVAVLPKIGVSYELNDMFLFSAGVGKSYGIQTDDVYQSYWKVFLKVGYNFDN